MHMSFTLPPNWQRIENVRIVAPALAVIFAITFNLGFFTSIGLAWYTLFSFGEHLQIAIASSPIIVLMVIFFYANLFVIYSAARVIDNLNLGAWRASFMNGVFL